MNKYHVTVTMTKGTTVEADNEEQAKAKALAIPMEEWHSVDELTVEQHFDTVDEALQEYAKRRAARG